VQHRGGEAIVLSEPRTISLITELIHLPMVHAQEKLREVYQQVCKSCGYENFHRLPSGGATIERKDVEGEGKSVLSFLNDRIQLTEDHTGASAAQFGKKAIGVLATTLPALGIPILLIQQTTVRIITAPNSFRNASEYLAKGFFKVRHEDLEPLGRPTNLFGCKLIFPPTQEEPHNFSVRVECYVRDGRSLYIENVGTFKTPIQPASLDTVEKNLKQTADFLVENVIKFLSVFDRREPE